MISLRTLDGPITIDKREVARVEYHAAFLRVIMIDGQVIRYTPVDPPPGRLHEMLGDLARRLVTP